MGIDRFFRSVLDRHAARLVQRRIIGRPSFAPTGGRRGGHPDRLDTLLDRVSTVRKRTHGQLRLECLLSSCHTRIDRRVGRHIFDSGARRVAGMGLFGATDSFRARFGTLVCTSIRSVVVIMK